MKSLAFMSMKGGSGITTVAANAGIALSRLDSSVLIIDLCPSDQLKFHLGFSFSDSKNDDHNGYHAVDGVDTVLKKSEDNLFFIPYTKDNEKCLDHSTLENLLKKLKLTNDTFVIFDCSILSLNNNNEISQKIANAVDQLILVLTADPACYINLFNKKNIDKKTRCLVNKFNPVITLEADFLDVLYADLPELMLPFNIHLDEHVREALAHKKTVLDYSAESQASFDYGKLASWLKSQDK